MFNAENKTVTLSDVKEAREFCEFAGIEYDNSRRAPVMVIADFVRDNEWTVTETDYFTGKEVRKLVDPAETGKSVMTVSAQVKEDGKPPRKVTEDLTVRQIRELTGKSGRGRVGNKAAVQAFAKFKELNLASLKSVSITLPFDLAELDDTSEPESESVETVAVTADAE